MAPQNKKLEKFQKQKKLEKAKKKNKKIYSRLFRKFGCFTKTPSELFFWFYCFFAFLEVLLVFGFLQVFAVVLHVCLLFKAVL